MNTRRLSVFFSVVTAFALIAGADGVFAQGKGKGNGKHGGGNPHGDGGKHGGGNRGGGQPAGFPGGGNGKHGRVYVQQAPPAFQGFPGRGRGAEKRAAMPAPVQIYRPQPNVYYQQQTMPQLRGNGKVKHQKQKDVRQQIPVWGDVFPRNYGQQRSAEVHQRNAERKANKQAEKAYKQEQKAIARYREAPRYYQAPQYRPQYQQAVPQYYEYRQPQYEDRARQYARPNRYYGQPSYPEPGYSQQYNAQPYYPQPYDFSGPVYRSQEYTPYYGDGYDSADNGFDVQDVLRDIIFSVLSGGGLDSLGGLPGAYLGNGSYGQFLPSYSSYGTRFPAASQYSYAASGRRYADDSPYDGYVGPDAYYPLQILSGGAGDGGMFREMFSELLAVGYDEGYRQGLAARRTVNRRDAYFNDPYAYDNEFCSPYSTSLGDNRQFLSQGYELGYEDALNGLRDYEQMGESGDIDLLSILLGVASQVM